jgi:hypothetical protein
MDPEGGVFVVVVKVDGIHERFDVQKVRDENGNPPARSARTSDAPVMMTRGGHDPWERRALLAVYHVTGGAA